MSPSNVAPPFTLRAAALRGTEPVDVTRVASGATGERRAHEPVERVKPTSRAIPRWALPGVFMVHPSLHVLLGVVWRKKRSIVAPGVRGAQGPHRKGRSSISLWAQSPAHVPDVGSLDGEPGRKLPSSRRAPVRIVMKYDGSHLWLSTVGNDYLRVDPDGTIVDTIAIYHEPAAHWTSSVLMFDEALLWGVY